jgi:hypothetical protein
MPHHHTARGVTASGWPTMAGDAGYEGGCATNGESEERSGRGSPIDVFQTADDEREAVPDGGAWVRPGHGI